MPFDPSTPYNELPPLPPPLESIETAAILKKCISARVALAELKQAAELIPNAAVLVNALPLLEGVLKEHGDFVEARVLLASVYYRLNRKQDGDREKALIQKSNAEQQAKQPGAQVGEPTPTPKPPR